MGKERVDKILASQNVGSRSQVKEMIKEGRIRADGQTVKRPEEKYDPETVCFSVDGKQVQVRRFLYIMMNKPKGVLSASEDRFAKTVIDLLPQELRRRDLFPAGRLDKDTEGLILITDDGELSHKMLSPKHHVYKLYEAQCDRILTEEDVRAFADGITEGGDTFLPAELKLIGERKALVEVCEGKFHQIKRMFHACGAEVTELKRLRIGGVTLDETLRPGESRLMEKDETALLLSRKHGI